MREAGEPLLFECVQAGCHVLLRGRRGTLWHSKLFDNVSKMSKLEEVSYEMLHTWVVESCLCWLMFLSCYCGTGCHVSLNLLRQISAVLGFKVLINIHSSWQNRCRCLNRSIEAVSSVMQVAVMFIRLLGSAATQCPRSRQTSIQACGLCGCLFSMLFIGVVFQVSAELEAWHLQHLCRLQTCLLDCWARRQHIALAVIDRHRFKHARCVDVCFQCCS